MMNPASASPFRTISRLISVLPALFAAGILLLSPTRVCAQDELDAFQTITLGAQFTVNVGRTSFNEFWDPSNGGLFQIDMPFYLGIVQTGVHFFSNNSLAADVPPFDSVNLYLGWGYEWALPLRLGWFAGVRAGGFYMNFDDDAIADEVKTESELGVGLNTALRYPLDERWSVLVSAEYLEVFTRRRIEYGFVGIGLSRTFTTPRPLREFLR